MPSAKQQREKAAKKAKHRADEAASRAQRGLAVARAGRLGVLIEETHEFVSPFGTPAFRWLFVQQTVGTIGGIIQGAFTFYWFQDCFSEGYWFLGYHITDSVRHVTQTAGSNRVMPVVESSACTESSLKRAGPHRCRRLSRSTVWWVPS
jgi:hypothetical protein